MCFFSILKNFSFVQNLQDELEKQEHSLQKFGSVTNQLLKECHPPITETLNNTLKEMNMRYGHTSKYSKPLLIWNRQGGSQFLLLCETCSISSICHQFQKYGGNKECSFPFYATPEPGEIQ